MLDAHLTEYAIKGLEAELAALDTKRATLLEKLQSLRGRGRRSTTTAPAAPRKAKRARPVMSEEGRKRIAAAQRARWARVAAQQEEKKKAAPAKNATKPSVAADRAERLAKARQAKAAKKALAAAPVPPEREIARAPMPRHVRKQRPPQQPATQAQA